MHSPSRASMVRGWYSWQGAGLLVLAASLACKSEPTGPAAPLTVTVSPASFAATRFQSVALSLTVKDASGVAVSPDSVHWSSADSTKASVSATGVVYTKASTPGTNILATAFRGRSQGTGASVVTITAFP